MKNIYYLITVCSIILTSCGGPSARFIVPDSSIAAPEKIKLENTSEGAEQYIWDFGDGTTSTDSIGSHRYYASGNYLVRLKAIKGKKVDITEKRIKVDAPEKCLVRIQTPYGDMIAELFDDTPKHRDNFTKLADDGFYNDLLFHRVINGFMIQGGDPNSKNASENARLGIGGPGYEIDAEINPDYVHKKGALAAARKGDQVNPMRKSSGSQFYIVQGKTLNDQEINRMEMTTGMRYTPEQKESYKTEGGTPFLDNNYTVFGQVVEGIEIIDKIANQPTGAGDRPSENIWMKVAVIK